MPELPEVETIKNDLKEKILNKKIKTVDLRLKKIVKNPAKDFISILEGNNFKEIKRRGKLLIFTLAKKNKYLTIHLRMTGQLVYQKGKKITAGGHSDNNNIINLPNKYTHIIFCFSDKSQLFFNDLRRFGVVRIVNREELENILNGFGVEPLEKDLSLKTFQDIIKKRKGNVKAFLLDQKCVVGIGNIYADEILFEAKILPNRKIVSLKIEEVEAIYKAIKKILKKAIKYRGTTFYSYIDARGQRGNFTRFLKVYKQEKKKCLRCKKGIIQKVKIAGRGTRYCDKCQK
ncbi:MAG: bifunctional DNA-formamidopyrimidine glycosylase/DNA-(apurinic or apyrimidinic site) lyase [Candidatus Andersenbacteria bacterium]|nr:bifunctional DNA-formamidopyrimidine glycosylase/DNA-(apurinic or apyrimidinic site) lyase [Candidatus Andersenbacteria bacterium]